MYHIFSFFSGLWFDSHQILSFKAVNGLAPHYICDLLTPTSLLTGQLGLLSYYFPHSLFQTRRLGLLWLFMLPLLFLYFL